MLASATTHRPTLSLPRHFLPSSTSPTPNPIQETVRFERILSCSTNPAVLSSRDDLSVAFHRTGDVRGSGKERGGERGGKRRRRAFFVDVNSIYYKGQVPSLRAFADWISMFFDKVSFDDPVIAVIDGEGGNEYRRQLLPSYKAHRNMYSPVRIIPKLVCPNTGSILVWDMIQVVKVEGHEADDVVATLITQVLEGRLKVVIASRDKDFKQLISEDVQLAIPMENLGRWSFYTKKHYLAQYQCDPGSDLSLRCIIGDEADGVSGIQTFVPAFGRNTALKLLKKHGSLESLLKTAAVRTVGKPYVQDALIQYADHLRKNYQVLSLKRDIDVHLQDEWLLERETCNDSYAVSNLYGMLGGHENPNDRWTYQR
ncbi:5'-3' exonuclease-like protein [Drosera capensis]